MNQNQVIEGLKQEAKENKAAEAFFHVCAFRKRARSQLTLHGLSGRMKKEGFTFPKPDYERILKRMGDLGLGRLQTDDKGRPVALHHITTSLQSIGKVAISDEGQASLQGWRKRTRFTYMSNVGGRKTRAKKAAPAAPVKQPEPVQAPATVMLNAAPTQPLNASAGSPVSLTFLVNGKPVSLGIPQNLDEKDVATLVTRFRDKAYSMGSKQ